MGDDDEGQLEDQEQDEGGEFYPVGTVTTDTSTDVGGSVGGGDDGGGDDGGGDSFGGWPDGGGTDDGTITDAGPVDADLVFPADTIVGPPPDVLANPALLSAWNDLQAGWDAARSGVSADQLPWGASDYFIAGYNGYFNSTAYDGPAVSVPPDGPPTPYTDMVEEWLKWLDPTEQHVPPEKVETQPVAD